MSIVRTSSLGAIFDWDGVVINSADLHRKSWEILSAELELPLIQNHFVKGFGKRNDVIIKDILSWSNNAEEIATLGNRKEQIYRQLGSKSGIPMVPGTIDFLNLLKNSAISCAIGTSTERENVAMAIDQHGLDDFFLGAICTEDVSFGKPNPEVFIKAAELLKKQAEDCLVFEDSVHGIEAAVNGGMLPVGISTTHSKKRLIEAGAYLVVESLDEINLSILEDLIKSRN